ncbi:MAG: hypothetical protein AAB217_28055, partial [Chloroflexota bacterium]
GHAHVADLQHGLGGVLEVHRALSSGVFEAARQRGQQPFEQQPDQADDEDGERREIEHGMESARPDSRALSL